MCYFISPRDVATWIWFVALEATTGLKLLQALARVCTYEATGGFYGSTLLVPCY